MLESTKFGKELWMSQKCENSVEIRVVIFSLTFSMHPQKWKSDIDNSRYCEKTTEDDLRQSVESTKFGKELGMSQKCEISIEIWVVKFPLTFPMHTEKKNPTLVT